MDFPWHFLHYLESLKLSVVAGVPPFVLLMSYSSWALFPHIPGYQPYLLTSTWPEISTYPWDSSACISSSLSVSSSRLKFIKKNKVRRFEKNKQPKNEKHPTTDQKVFIDWNFLASFLSGKIIMATRKKYKPKKKRNKKVLLRRILLYSSLFLSSYFAEFKTIMFPLPLLFFSKCSISH